MPDNDFLTAFCIRQPHLNVENIEISIDSNDLEVRSVLDLPLFYPLPACRYFRCVTTPVLDTSRNELTLVLSYNIGINTYPGKDE